MIRFLPPTIGLLAALVPGLARAQTNLDQGKSASQIFASACAECHKDARALGKGKNASVLTNFLDEHYTTNTQQAAALAAFIMGGRGGEPIGAAAQGRGQKPAAQRASASTEEPKPPKHQATQSAKPEDGKPADGKPHRPTREAAKPRDNASPSERPSFLGIIAPEPGQHNRPSTASRSRKEPKTPPPGQEPAAATHEPAPVVTEPGPAEAPASSESHASPSTTAAAPANAASGEPGEAPVPRDNVPD